MEARDRILVALDTNDIGKLNEYARALGPHVGGFKIGLEALLSIGLKPALNAIRGYGPAAENVFVDAKLHDIPDTVAAAVRAIVEHPQVKFVNLHASAGIDAVQKAAKAKGQAKLLAVTVLTSLDDAHARVVYGEGDAAYHVARLAQIAFVDGRNGADGVVCSPHEAQLVKKAAASWRGDLITVVPGVRPEWAESNDQKRVMTPGEAVCRDADYVVIGRPITKPPGKIGSPAAAAKLIAEEIRSALG